MRSITFKDGSVLLFYGDSITDAVRERESGIDLGDGFVRMIAAYLQYTRPDMFIKIFNRGIAGDSIHDLTARMEEDCLKLRPDVVSILVGVNDATYRAWLHRDPAPLTAEDFEQHCRILIEGMRRENPKVQIVLSTPYLCETTCEHRINKRRLEEYIPVITRLAEEYDCALIPLHAIMDREKEEGRTAVWLEDGVHPTPAGALFLADAWIRHVLGERWMNGEHQGKNAT